MKHNINFIFLSLFSLFLVGCASSIGTTHLYRIDNNKQLGTPWEPIYLTKERKDIIYRSTEETKKVGSDIFSIFISDAYFRYLPDLGGVNEVIIVAEFSEADAKNGEKLIKVLGPYRNIADFTKGQFFNKPIYGPKRLESNLLSMDIKVYEYDQEEKENNAAMLDFIADLGSSLSVANPVTIAEIALAKKVAKAINDTNKNDLVMHADISFIAGESNLNWLANYHTKGILLKAGTMVLIKQEACQVGNCYDYFIKGDKENPVAWIADGLMALPVALKRGLTDSPDNNALKAIDDHLVNGDFGIEHKVDGSLYTDKTWLRINIVKGGDASKWEARKALWALDKDIQEKVKNAEPDFYSLGKALDEAKKKTVETALPLSINTPGAYQGQYFFYADVDDLGFCLSFDQGAKLNDIPRVIKNKSSVALIRSMISPEGTICYVFKTSNKKLNEGIYKLGVDYLLNDTLYTEWFTLLSIPKPNISKFECLPIIGENQRNMLEVRGSNLDYLTGLEVDGVYTKVNSTNSKTELELKSGQVITKLFTPAGEIKLSQNQIMTVSSCEKVK